MLDPSLLVVFTGQITYSLLPLNIHAHKLRPMQVVTIKTDGGDLD
jgi:hypothetical protein